MMMARIRFHSRQAYPDAMKMFSHSIPRFVVRLLCGILFFCGFMRASADTEAFEIRAAAPYYGRTLTQLDTGVSYTLGTFSYLQTWNGSWWDGYAVLTNVGIDPDSGAQPWTFVLDVGTTVANGWSATVDSTAMTNARNGDHVLWLDFQPGTNANTSRNFLVSSDYAAHALGIVQPGNGGGTPVISPLSLGNSISIQDNAGNTVFDGVRATAPADPTKAFWVMDFTTGLRTPNGATLVRDGWVADPATYPLASATFYLDQISSGDRFTLHWQLPGQAEMMQSLVAASGNTGQQQLGDWSWEDETNTVSVTGSVALGTNYWLTRDSDGWSSGVLFMDPFAALPSPLQWSLRGLAGPPVPWQTISFYIATGYGWSASVVQQDGTRSLSPTYSGSQTIQDFDTSGNPHDFNYEIWTAQIDPREQFWLSVNGTQCSQGETWYYNGWMRQGGSPASNTDGWGMGPVSFTLSLTVGPDRALHDFVVDLGAGYYTSSSDGNGSGWFVPQSYQVYDPWFSEWWTQTASNFVRSWSFSVTNPGSWTLYDTTIGDSQSISPASVMSGSLDLTQWTLPPVSMPLQISLSRWGHDLRMRWRDGGEYIITPVSSQGFLVSTASGAWYQSYYYFDATSYASMKSGVDWWIYDGTTGEYANPNVLNLIDWSYAPAPSNVAARQDSIGAARLTWTLGPGGSELLAGGFVIERAGGSDSNWVQVASDTAQNFVDPQIGGMNFAYTDTGVNVGQFRYRVRYQYGQTSSAFIVSNNVTVYDEATLAMMFTDGSGMNDLWELTYFHHLGVNPSGLIAGNSGLTNLEACLLGMNPTVPPDTSALAAVGLAVFAP